MKNIIIVIFLLVSGWFLYKQYGPSAAVTVTANSTGVGATSAAVIRPSSPTSNRDLLNAIKSGKAYVFSTKVHLNAPNEDAVAWMKRDAYFIDKILAGYSSKAVIINDQSSVEFNYNDIIHTAFNEMERNNWNIFVIKPEGENAFKLYGANTLYDSRKPTDIVAITDNLMRTALGPGAYNYKEQIKKTSAFAAFNRATAEGKKIILINFQGACPYAFGPTAQAKAAGQVKSTFGAETEVLEIKNIKNYYLDPAVEVMNRTRDFMTVYDQKTDKAASVKNPAAPQAEIKTLLK